MAVLVCIPTNIHFNIWQNQYNIVKFKNKIKLKKNKIKSRDITLPTTKKKKRKKEKEIENSINLFSFPLFGLS